MGVLLVGACMSAAFLCGSAPLPARAEPTPAPTDDAVHGNYGNGTRNHNIQSVKSPTNNVGFQHSTTSTAGGMTNIQNAMCKNVKVCNITQQVSPRMPAATANTTETVLPELTRGPVAQTPGVLTEEPVSEVTEEPVSEVAEEPVSEVAEEPVSEVAETSAPQQLGPLPYSLHLGELLTAPVLSPITLVTARRASATGGRQGRVSPVTGHRQKPLLRVHGHRAPSR